ncbi:hypothetical protein ROJ8625_04091 [Roseivivax jejudonensis]|uniref:Peptidase S74 domain-containing protein n=1 Tax=Roseivivax jejudonensis TaxID=1529041 RepID=A0A1X7AD98_9RHOB|nr:hypothetical protein [Roseivivax jejudonensis]SLN74737.1 hypothetical protein ROJ8625_04091 [Roseivivax jejudonensis]
MCSPSAPKPPDPEEVQRAQTGTNVTTAVANSVLMNPNQTTPYGSLTYSFGDSNVPQIEQYTIKGTPGTASGPTVNDNGQRQFGLNMLGGGNQGTPDTTGYRVGGETFDTYEAAQEYQRGLPGYDPNSTYTWTDPSTGDTYSIPRVTIEQTLSPEGRQLQDAQVNTQINLAELARDSSSRLGQLLGTSMDPSALPDRGDLGAGYVQNLNQRRNNLMVDGLEQASGNVQNTDNQLQTSVDGARYRNSFSAGGRVQQSLDDRSGDIQTTVPQQQFQTEFGDAGDITRSYGTDFSDDRRRVEEALFSRLNPQLDRDRESLRTSLLNQGIREGSEAYDRAMNRFNEQSNDARMQTILAGGQEQSRLADLEARRAGFENAAQAQAYQQAQGRGVFANNARGQQFQTDLAGAQFGNQAVGQQYQQSADAMTRRNAAQQQQFGQNQAQAQFYNDATADQLQSDIARGTFANDARGQQFQQRLAEQQLANQAATQNNAAQMDASTLNAGLLNQQEQSYNALQQRRNDQRSAALQEMFAFRNQPINEIASLLGTGQVQQPNFVTPNMSQIPTVDRAGLEMDAYQGRLNAWQQQQAGRQALMGGILGAAGSLGGAYIGTL